MIRVLKLFLSEIADVKTRENFSRIERFFRDDVFRKFQPVFFQYVFRESTTYPAVVTVPHNFNFVPKDVIQLSVSNDAVITWHYDDFTINNITLESDKACTVRAFIGSYAEV